jgi:aldose 1-epimerase
MKKYTLENDFQKITFLDVGATIYSWEIKQKSNRNIVLSNDNLNDYLDNRCGYFGATIGRVANRIKDGKFSLNGVEYQLDINFDNHANAGHGGQTGFWMQPFTCVSHDKSTLVFSYTSPNGHEGYPGNLTLKVTYRLEGSSLLLTYDAQSDQDTPINITNHSYFNLDGSDTIVTHRLQVDAPLYLPYDVKKAVTGEMLVTENTALDFSNEKPLAIITTDPELQDDKTRGIDHCLIMGDKKQLTLKGQDLKLMVTTSYPAVQLYGSGFPGNQLLLGKRKFNKYHALAIEPQLPVDAINHPHLGSMVLKKGESYHHFIRYELEVIA